MELELDTWSTWSLFTVVAAKGMVAGDGAVHDTRNQSINKSDTSDSEPTNQGGNIHSQQPL